MLERKEEPVHRGPLQDLDAQEIIEEWQAGLAGAGDEALAALGAEELPGAMPQLVRVLVQELARPDFNPDRLARMDPLLKAVREHTRRRRSRGVSFEGLYTEARIWRAVLWRKIRAGKTADPYLAPAELIEAFRLVNGAVSAIIGEIEAVRQERKKLKVSPEGDRIRPALEESEARFRQLVESSPDGIVIHAEDRVLYSNPAAARMLRADSPEQIVGRSVLDFVHPDFREIVASRLKRMVETGEPVPALEERFVCLDGTSIDVEVTALPISYHGRSGIEVVFRDISERKRVEEALRESEERYRTLFDSAYDAIYLIEPSTGRIIDCNSAAVRLDGYSKDELKKMFVADLHPDEERPELPGRFKEVAERGAVSGISGLHHLTKDGRLVPIEVNATMIDLAGRRLNLSAVRDITERERTRAELERALSLQKATLEATADGILAIDRDGRFVAHNRRFVEIWGIPEDSLRRENREEVLSVVASKVMRPEEFMSKVKELDSHPELESFDLIEFKDGRVIERYARPQRLGDRIVGRVYSFRDVTESRRAAESLRASEERYRSLFYNNHAVMLLIDPESGEIVDANPAACAYYGYDYPTLTSMKITDINVLSEGEVFAEMDRARRQERMFFEFRHRLASGEIRDVEVYSGPIEAQGRRLLYSIVHDMTLRRQAEEALRESEEKYRRLLESANDAIFIADAESGLILEANRKAEEMLKLPRERIVGMHQSELHPPELREMYAKLFADFVRFGTPIPRDLLVADSRGNRIPVEISPSVIELRGRTVVQGIFRDITERKQAEDALADSRERLRSTLSSMDDLVFVLDREGRYVEFYQPSKGAELYMPAEVFLGKHYREVGLPEDAVEHIDRAFKALQTSGDVQAFDYQLVIDGNPRWYSAKISRRLTPAGEFDGVTSVVRDITERKEAEERAARLAEEAQLLLEVSEIITSSLHLKEIMGRLVAVAASLTGLGRASVLLKSGEEQLELAASTDPGLGVESVEGAADQLVVTPRVASDIRNDPPPALHVCPQDMASAIIVPLCIGRDCLGALLLDEPGVRTEFSERQVRLAEAIGRQAAFAIQNAQAYETQANIAATLQRSLLPEPVETIDDVEVGLRYVSATQGALLGGDFYDYFILPDGRLAVAVGDVSGKGFEAAIETAMVKYSLETLVATDPSPAHVMEALNNALSLRLSSGRFITMFYALIDAEKGTVRCTNAGHLAPVIRRAGGECLVAEEAASLGTALGIFGGRKYQEAELALAPGDLLILFTDGLTEARSAADRREMFEADRAVRVLSAKKDYSASKWVDILYSAVEEFTGGNLTDDLAILALRLRRGGLDQAANVGGA